MKLLVIRQENPFATSNASNNRFLSLAEGLIEKGCSLDLLFLSGFYNKAEKKKFGKTGICNNINYKYLLPVDYSIFIIRQFFYRIFPITYLHQKIENILKGVEYDYIWLDFGPKVVQVGIRLFKSNPDLKYFHERSEFSWIGLSQFKWLHKRYLYEFLPQIDIMSVMTSTLKNYYKDFVGEKTKMIHIPMTVDFSRFVDITEDNRYSKPYIAYCGTMKNAKDGVHILIQSFISILDRFPKLHLYIAGPLIPKADYIMQKALIAEAKAEKRIIYLGTLSREEIPTFLCNARVLAMARPESKQAEGGFPTKLGEYLATGKPVCVTNVGEIGQYLKNGEAAYLAQPGSIGSFADALKEALTSKNSLNIGASGKEVAFQNFNKDIQATILFDFLFQNQWECGFKK